VRYIGFFSYIPIHVISLVCNYFSQCSSPTALPITARVSVEVGEEIGAVKIKRGGV